MPKSKNQDSVPVVSIQGYRQEQVAGRQELLFNELHGKRRIDKPHKHDFFIIILFERAAGTHRIDSVEYPIGNQEIHVLFPGQIHEWDIKEGTRAYQLMIERVFFEQFAPFFRFSFTNYQNHPVIKLAQNTFDRLMYEFHAIKEELTSNNSLVHLINARAAVIAAIVSKEAEHIFTEFKVYQSNPRLAKFNMLIDEFYKEHKSVVYYAEQLHISANYLNILCKKHLKVSASELIQQRVFTEAKRLLQTEVLGSIKEIAFELGYVDHAYFSNFFKAQAGVTPTEFRRKNKATLE